MSRTLFSLLLCAALPALADDISVQHAWARATVPGQPVSGAYFDITAAHDAKLTKVSTPAAGEAQVHEMKMNQGMMQMRAIPALALPAGKTVTLAPNGYHVMLMDLKGPLKAGDKLPLTLTVERNGKSQQVQVQADIKASE